MKIGNYTMYNDPLMITWRAGTEEDPYIDVVDNLAIILNKTVLSEIPDEFHRVQINGYVELIQNTYNPQLVPNDNQFIVNYTNGVVTFNPSQNGKLIVPTYKGRGQIQYPAERIYVHSPNPYAVQNLQEFVELCEIKIAEINMAIGNAIDATNKAIVATDNAIIATNNTIKAINDAETATTESILATEACKAVTNESLIIKDQLIDARNKTILIWQDPVNSYSELSAKFPNPEVGWTSIDQTTGIVYRWEGIAWRDIGNMTLSVPPVSEATSGLMSPLDYIKLRDIEENAQVNFTGEDAKVALPDYFRTKVVTFIVPEQFDLGSNNILIKFPYSGEITKISACLDVEGIDNTEIDIMKISEIGFKNKETWESILNNKLNLPYSDKTDDGLHTINTTLVNANDYFQINVLKVGANAMSLLVEIEIKI